MGMSKGMKYHPNKSVLFCTFSLEEGLLLLANSLCKSIVKSCLARAQTLHPVQICHLLVEASHVHMVIVVVNPDDVHGFIRCFKTESAHMINGLLGREKRTVWCEGYDSPVVLTPVRALVAIAYLYSNPAKDNLESSIERYPGFSSWEMFRSGNSTKQWKRLRRPQFCAISRDANNQAGYSRLAERILAESKDFQTFTLEPDAWIKAFGISSAEEIRKINARLVARVRDLEERAERRRMRTRSQVLGRAKLQAQVLDTGYRSRRSGRRTWCLAEKRGIRMAFIRFMKQLMVKAREVQSRWALGDRLVPYPAGLYPPCMPKLANVLVGPPSRDF